MSLHDPRYLKPEYITPDKINKAVQLNKLAQMRGQSLAQMALQWVLRSEVVTSALIGASAPEQILENVHALDCGPLTEAELKEIDEILGES